ncbi:MAG: hypothetical protein WCO95_06065 [Actinomycetes bacterium]
MFNTKLPHMMCVKCGAQVARDAYYCKKCGEVIDDTVAPGLKREDRRFSSKLRYAIQRHLIKNTLIAVFLIGFAIALANLGLNFLHTNKDNGSSQIFKMTVLSAANPMTCRGAICHILIDIRNKTNAVQNLDATPDLVTAAGKKFGAADPARMGNGENYCRPRIKITLQPHEVARYIGICSQDIPAGTSMVLAELRDPSGGLAVSGVFKALAY